MLFAALVLASIMTESNGTFADAPSNAAVAVASRYIPYGTYTDGDGGTEYKRVSTNLVGAIASMIDGLWERVALPYGWLPEDLADGDAELKYPLRETARDSKRIFATAINDYGYGRRGEGFAEGIRYPIEETLANGYVYEYWAPGPGGVYTYKTNAVHAGIAGSALNGYIDSEGLRFREYEPVPIAWTSRQAEEIFGDPEPPISKTWSGRLPFLTQYTNTWRRVFAPYSAYEYDPHFFQSNYEDFVAFNLDYARPHIRRWMMAEHVDDLWGRDVLGGSGDGAGTDLEEWLRKTPVATNAVMEEVLKIDPDWKYVYPPKLTNDYWTIDGMRLDRDSIAGEWDDLANAYVAYWGFYTDGLWYVIGARYGATEWSYICFDADTIETIFVYFVSGTPTSTSLDFEGHLAEKTELRTHADDFKHWRNMTKRLDWKRLGIIAQLERQMEITYRAREREDYLPLWEFLVRAHRNYTGSLPLHIKIEDGEITEAYVVGHKPSLSLRYASWAFDGESAIAETNRTTSSYPTARTVVNLDGSVVGSTYSPASGTFDVRDDLIFEAIADAIARFVNPWPAGAKRISVDLNVTAAGISVAMIFVWFGPDDVTSFSAGDAPVGSFVVPDTEVDDTFALSRDDAKIARDITTMANKAGEDYKLMGRDIPAAYPAEMSETAVSNLESRLWRNGYIKSITLPTIEVRLAATNNYWAAQRDAEPAMPWLGEIGKTNADIRAFRYQCDVKDSVGLDNSRGDRLLSLRDLDSEVKKHFKKFAGRDITSGLAGRATFNAAEIAEFDRAIANANAVVRLDKQVVDARLVFEAEFNFDNGWKDGDTADLYRVSPELGTNLVRQLVYSTTNYVAHPYGDWAVNVSASAYPAVTNSGIRVDGHQNQMMKTLWKFKNMRDPGL